MQKIKALLLVLVVVGASLSMMACKEESTFEKAGKQLDKAAQDAGEQAEEAGKEMKKAVE